MDVQDEETTRTLLAEVLEQLGPVAVMTALRDADDTIVDFRYEYVNPAFCAALGETSEALVGNRLLELYPSHLDLGLFDAYCDVVYTGVPYVSELPWFDERNAHAYFEVRVTPFRDGYLLSGQDVTARTLAEQAQRMLHTAERSTPDATAAPPANPDQPHTNAPEQSDAELELLLDTEVEVWVRSTRRWAAGFRVEGRLPDGSLLVRRTTDRHALPQPFARQLVRPLQRRATNGW
jgi:hypothetical protein